MRDCADPLADVLYQELTRAATPRPRRMRREMRQLTATFHVSTPLFIGNAAQEPELLAAPFKRALRFWWRALNYSLVKSGEGKFEDLLAKEAELFGAAANDRGDGRGRCPFSLRVRFEGTPPAQFTSGELLEDAGHRVGLIYLGYGVLLMESRRKGIKAGTLDRGCIWSAGGFSVRMDLSYPNSRQADETFLEAIKLFGLLGGIGGRSRRGFGSVSLISLKGDAADISWQPPATSNDYAREVRTLLKSKATAHPIPEYTAFGPDARIEVVDEGSNSCAMLDGLGQLMQRYRGWGRYGRVNGEPSEKRFTRDHDWYLYWKLFSNPRDPDFPTRVADGKTRPDGSTAPQRLVFGLPQNYLDHLSVVGPTIRENLKIDRRGSPLFVHIHKLGSGYATVLALLPSRFLPKDEVDVAFRQERYHQKFQPDFTVISRFFDAVGTTGSMAERKYFDKKTRVWPI